MATTRTAKAHWEGSLIEGAGQVALTSSGIGTYDVSWASRANEANGKTSPEELIAAAHSTCFSMSLSHALAGAGHAPESIDTTADVTFQPGEGITGIVLSVNGKVPGLTAEQFAEFAEDAKKNCPVSQALTGTTITLDVTFTA
jgi:osmotically inducible protein OsmC